MRRFYLIAFFGLLAFYGGVVIHFGEALRSEIVPRLAAQAESAFSASRTAAPTATVSTDSSEKTLVFVGDIMLSRGVAHQIEKKNDSRYPFLKVAEVTGRADMAFANLEGPISSRGQNQGSLYSFRDDPKVVEGLTYSGFDVLSIANNHIMDWGQVALQDTVNILKAAGIHSVGAGRNEEEANQPYIVELGDTNIAYLAYTTLYPKSFEAGKDAAGVSHFDLEAVTKKIQELKSSKAADIVIVSFHWGEEYQTQPLASQKEIARALIDAGADLIIGHHPHVVQEIEHYKNGWIAYSLGNFVFDQGFSEGTKKGLMLVVKIKNRAVSGVAFRDILINDTFQPSL